MVYSSYMLFIMPLIGVMIFLLQQKHLLMVLLSLEAITLTMVLFISVSISYVSMSLPVVSVLILTFGACEASFGLSLMVIMSRSYGSDMMSLMSTNKC